MKMTKWITGILVAAVIALVGCGKKSSESTPPPGTIDIMKLQEALQNATPEQRASLDKVKMGIRYGQYPNALAELDKLANDAQLNAEQKKAVNDVIEQVKKAVTAPPPGAPTGTQ